MSNASELVDDLLNRPLTPEEVAAKYPKVPELRLRPDAPGVTVDDNTLGSEIVERLGEKDSLALYDHSGAARAIVLPLERYIQLVGTELVNDPRNNVATPDGRISPTDEALAASYVEQVNREDTWGPARGSNTPPDPR